MKLETKYNIGERIGFIRNDKETIAMITDIQLNVNSKGDVRIMYTIDRNAIVPQEYGEPVEVPMSVYEEEIKGSVKITYL